MERLDGYVDTRVLTVFSDVSLEISRVDEQKLVHSALALQYKFIPAHADLHENIVFAETVRFSHTAFGFPRKRLLVAA